MAEPAPVDPWWLKFAERKIASSEKLLNECGGSYGDVILIFTGVISTMAAERWPGRGFDNKRFIELLVEFAPETRTISVPRLCNHLLSHDLVAQAKQIWDYPENEFLMGEILQGPDIDSSEKSIANSLTTPISPKAIRRYSYASLLYNDLRCSYSHEYKIGDDAHAYKMTRSKNSCISYVNYHKEPFPFIHFDLNWLANVVRKCASVMVERQPDQLSVIPAEWWINGGVK